MFNLLKRMFGFGGQPEQAKDEQAPYKVEAPVVQEVAKVEQAAPASCCAQEPAKKAKKPAKPKAPKAPKATAKKPRKPKAPKAAQ